MNRDARKIRLLVVLMGLVSREVCDLWCSVGFGGVCCVVFDGRSFACIDEGFGSGSTGVRKFKGSIASDTSCVE
jgi:hypothetical protein